MYYYNANVRGDIVYFKDNERGNPQKNNNQMRLNFNHHLRALTAFCAASSKSNAL